MKTTPFVATLLVTLIPALAFARSKTDKTALAKVETVQGADRPAEEQTEATGKEQAAEGKDAPTEKASDTPAPKAKEPTPKDSGETAKTDKHEHGDQKGKAHHGKKTEGKKAEHEKHHGHHKKDKAEAKETEKPHHGHPGAKKGHDGRVAKSETPKQH